jgi:hypothetical protein
MKAEFPPLPELQFAEIPAASRDKYQGDRHGHLPEVEAPEIVNKMLKDFFG